jgi:SOS-response transcriptional repressor LexA
MPENPLFDTINLVGEEMNQATILGKAVAVVSFLNKRETGDG